MHAAYIITDGRQCFAGVLPPQAGHGLDVFHHAAEVCECCHLPLMVAFNDPALLRRGVGSGALLRMSARSMKAASADSARLQRTLLLCHAIIA